MILVVLIERGMFGGKCGGFLFFIFLFFVLKVILGLFVGYIGDIVKKWG